MQDPRRCGSIILIVIHQHLEILTKDKVYIVRSSVGLKSHHCLEQDNIGFIDHYWTVNSDSKILSPEY